MKANSRSGPSQLFTIRIWREELGHGRFEIRGQVKHIRSGEIVYFREWSSLHAFLIKRLWMEDLNNTNV